MNLNNLTGSTNSGSTNYVPPRCERHDAQMRLYFYERPGSPQGNGWGCPFCIEERTAQQQTKWPEGAEL